jgi:hypothetical protein
MGHHGPSNSGQMEESRAECQLKKYEKEKKK